MDELRRVSWSTVIIGALLISALFIVFITFGLGIGLAVGSPAPTWRDSSFPLWIGSGLYLVVAAVLSSAAGSYLAGRLHPAPFANDTHENELASGIHGLGSWSLAVVLGAMLVLAGGAILTPAVSPAGGQTGQTRSLGAENLLAYELDRLFRADRRADVNLEYERSEAGRILLMSNSRNGIPQDDRAFLTRLVAARTGLAGGDAQQRVEAVITQSRQALVRSTNTGILMAFFTAAALLLGAVTAWFAAQRGERDAFGEEISAVDAIFRKGSPRTWFAAPRRRIPQSEGRPPI